MLLTAARAAGVQEALYRDEVAQALATSLKT